MKQESIINKSQEFNDDDKVSSRIQRSEQILIKSENKRPASFFWFVYTK